MIYYPVGIPTLCRYEHFRRCVNSLAKNTHADKTELVIGLDFPPAEKYREGYEQINQYIDQIQGFAKVTVFRHEKNLGAMENWLFIKQYIFEHYDAAIMTEDDNEFSPCFLDFMDKCLTYYKSEFQIDSICGCLHPQFHNLVSEGQLFKKETCAWGIGYFREKEMLFQTIPPSYWEDCIKSSIRSLKLILISPGMYLMLSDMINRKKHWGDVMKSVWQMENEKYQVAPCVNLVRNWGYDSTGLHCGSDDSISKWPLSDSYEYAFIDRKINNDIPYFITFNIHLQNNLCGKIRSIISAIYHFIIDRFR